MVMMRKILFSSDLGWLPQSQIKTIWQKQAEKTKQIINFKKCIKFRNEQNSRKQYGNWKNIKTFWGSQAVPKIPKCLNINKCSINNNKDTNNTFIVTAKMLSLQLYYFVQVFLSPVLFCPRVKLIIALLMKSSFESLFDRWIYFSLILY